MQLFSDQILVKFNQALEIGNGDELATSHSVLKSDKMCYLLKVHCLRQRKKIKRSGSVFLCWGGMKEKKFEWSFSVFSLCNLHAGCGGVKKFILNKR